jgi:predicted nucleic acid-binding protein
MRAVLVDTGPLVALIDKSDDWHQRCRDALATLDEPLVTVWPVLTEASHFLDESEQAQSTLLHWIENGSVRLASLTREDVPRIHGLMGKYADLPMDLADAAIVRVAEREHIERVFTIDRRDFEIYRPAHLARFRILP